ncbi:MAG: DNA repair protein RadC [Pseudomonadota bacterium]
MNKPTTSHLELEEQCASFRRRSQLNNPQDVDSLSDHALLELFIADVIPGAEVKNVTSGLLSSFGSLSKVITASENSPREIGGSYDAVAERLSLVAALSRRMAKAKLMNKVALKSWTELVAYCRIALAHLETEQVRIVYLNRSGAIIGEEKLTSGTVDHVLLYPREIARRALQENASGIILAHNHPGGTDEPSIDDIVITQKIVAACNAIGVRLQEHMIITSSAETYLIRDGYVIPPLIPDDELEKMMEPILYLFEVA